ncbi:hypothetical protein CALCODRAFT_489890 [Calocera cornea HHB12733]|uniref:Uncharacterized protein n=1 Tax=Calocera cornea HHB12733 TaxID=1353952 RepID=A0A165K0R0_9BASI|nr:hypothetical protein CALCODRAFT_489890 [Calocera cornea HHB12733]
MAYPPSVAAEQPANSVWLFPKEQACLGGYYTYMEAPVAGYEEKNISYKCINDQGGRWLLTASSPGKGTSLTVACLSCLLTLMLSRNSELHLRLGPPEE